MSENKGIPKCPSVLCKDGEILYSEIKKFNNVEMIEKYSKLCLNHLKNTNMEDIMTETNQNIILEKIRKERHEFIKREYPVAISYVIENALKSKLNRIDKKNKEHIINLSAIGQALDCDYVICDRFDDTYNTNKNIFKLSLAG